MSLYDDYEGDLAPELFEDLGGDAGELEQEDGNVRFGDYVILGSLIGSGNRDENDITNQIFFARHPGLPHTPLRKNQPELISEWLQIRDQIVRPGLSKAGAGSAGSGSGTGSGGTSGYPRVTGGDTPIPTRSATTPSTPNVPLGTLVRAPYGKRKGFRYTFTAQDLDLAARMLIGETGGDDSLYARGTMWAMVNRFAFLGDKHWGTLARFLQAYSQSLNKVASYESMKPFIDKCNSTFSNKECKFQPTSSDFYPNTLIRKGNLKRVIEALQKPFDQLPAGVRQAAYVVLSGQQKSLVGNHTDVGEMKEFYRREHGRKPNYDEWLAYTLEHVRKRKRAWRPQQIPFDQYKHHALFVDQIAVDAPEGVVQVVPPGGVALPVPSAPAPSAPAPRASPAPKPAPLPPPPSTGGQVPDGKTPLPGTVETRRAWTTNPPYRSQPGQRDPKTYNYVLDQFAVGANPRYAHRKNPSGSVSTFCNIYMWDVTRAMGAEVPHWVDKSGNPAAVGKGNEMNANATFDWLHKHGPRFGWSQVPLDQAISAANAGRPAVVAFKKPGGIGHVAMIRPGQATEWGPWMAQAGGTNSSWVRLWAGGPQKGIFKRNSPAVEFFTHD